jgi:hypothetical protein
MKIALLYNTLVSTPAETGSPYQLLVCPKIIFLLAVSGPEPLDLVYSVELDPNIIELDVHGHERHRGRERRGGLRHAGKQGPGQPLGGHGMEDNDMGGNGVGNNSTDDTAMDDYLAEDASLRAPYDDISRALEWLADERRPKTTTEADRTAGTRGKGTSP